MFCHKWNNVNDLEIKNVIAAVHPCERSEKMKD